MSDGETPFDEIEKPPMPKGTQRKTSPNEDAVLAAMVVAGATDEQIAEKFGRSMSWVANHKRDMRSIIIEHRKEIIEDMVEDYTDVISLCLFRMRERLTSDELAATIKDNDLQAMLKTVFNSRQLMIEAPTKIEGVQAGSLKGRALVDAIATAEEFNENFDLLMRRQIAAGVRQVTVEADEVEAIEGGEVEGGDTDTDPN